MEFINFVMALSPIVVVLVGILAFHQSAKKVAPVALVWTLILAFTYFNVTGATFKENVATYDPLVWKGLKEGLKIVLMVFGAFVILNLLRETGAIEDVKSTIAENQRRSPRTGCHHRHDAPDLLRGRSRRRRSGGDRSSVPRSPLALTRSPPSQLRCLVTRPRPLGAARA